MSTLQLLPRILSRHAPIQQRLHLNVARASLSTSTTDKTHLIINSLGADRLGIVSDVTKLVTDSGGSVGESHAIKIGTNFSLTMTISVPSDEVSDLTKSVQSMEGMSFHFVETEDPKNANKVNPSSPAVVGYTGRFKLSGADNPGLVHKVTSVLAAHGLSIDVMETNEEDAPFGGTTLFYLDGIANAPSPLPKSFDSDLIRRELSDLGESLNCEIELEDDVDRTNRPSWIWENVA